MVPSTARRAARPSEAGTGGTGFEQGAGDGLEEIDGLIEPGLHRRVAEIGQANHLRRGGGFAERQPARAARQCHTQQAHTVLYLAPALDRLGFQRKRIKIKAIRKPAKKLVKFRRWE
jgi:hypothetical protein